ncbi:MAG: ribosome silencing factor [Rhodomicrobium sp.]|jgi:ribosome-associated protein
MHIGDVEVLILKHNRSNTERRVLTLRPNVLHQEFSELKPRRAKRAPAASASLSRLITQALEDAKADEIVIIDLAGKTSLGDTMIVASGRSQRHVGAIADKLIEKLKEEGVRDTRVEGMALCDWVLVDAGDVIVHIFRPEAREFYNLEKMWGSERPKREEAPG